ncbi:DUF3710 domain-containing protein [Mycobacterium sp. 155]|uniref:DUF3710 domain-containing protein n=1 Tax=Mycobacterium sp. 155 TaxID=1157943 RepID=UPI00037541B8|nr:DUF3710 domain-containing protein [Mycobacterium sp. 155]
MAFGKRDKDQTAGDAALDSAADAVAEAGGGDDFVGPFDVEDFDDASVAAEGRLDLGSVLIPMPDGGQVQVELNEAGAPNAVWVVTPNGRFTIAAYAAPKSPGLWREVAAELTDSLRKDAASVAVEDGPWGREVVGVGNGGVVRFIGIDGYRWMVRCVVNGAPDTIGALADEARTSLADTVIRRGETPLPVRTPLAIELPEPMAAQLRAAAQAAAGQQEPPPQEQVPEPVARRSAQGSAMQQFRTITGG